MLIRDTLITILDGETRASRAPGTTMLRGGSEAALVAGMHSPEVVLFLIVPLRRTSVDIGGGCVLSFLPTTEAWHREMPAIAQVLVVSERQAEKWSLPTRGHESDTKTLPWSIPPSQLLRPASSHPTTICGGYCTECPERVGHILMFSSLW